MRNNKGEIVPAHEFEITEEVTDDFESGFHIRVEVGWVQALSIRPEV